MRIGVNVALSAGAPQTHTDIIAEVRAAAASGLATAWWPQLPPFDGLTPWHPLPSIAATGAIVDGIELGTSVSVTFVQHPLALAAEALTTQAIIGNRLTLGVGPSNAAVIEGVYGLDFARPARHMRDFLEVLIPALSGESVQHDGESYRAMGRVVIPGATPPSVLLAAVGPAMLRVAGELTDGVLTAWAGARAVAEHIVPSALRASGGRELRVVVNLPVVVSDDTDTTRDRISQQFEMAAGVPGYRAMFDVDRHTGPGAAAIVGNDREVVAAIGRLAEAGATDLLPSVFGTDTERARTLELLADLNQRVRQ